MTRLISMLHRQTSDVDNHSDPRDRQSGATFVPVRDDEALERLFAQSQEQPVVLLLHDPYCPISARAHRRVTEAGGEVHLIDVSHQHALYRTVEQRTGVRHESPQAFVLRDGKPIWHASHGRISTEALAGARDNDVADQPGLTAG